MLTYLALYIDKLLCLILASFYNLFTTTTNTTIITSCLPSYFRHPHHNHPAPPPPASPQSPQSPQPAPLNHSALQPPPTPPHLLITQDASGRSPLPAPRGRAVSSCIGRAVPYPGSPQANCRTEAAQPALEGTEVGGSWAGVGRELGGSWAGVGVSWA